MDEWDMSLIQNPNVGMAQILDLLMRYFDMQFTPFVELPVDGLIRLRSKTKNGFSIERKTVDHSKHFIPNQIFKGNRVDS